MLKEFGIFRTLGLIGRRIKKGHWSRFSESLGTSVSEATTETEMTGSPFGPSVAGRIVQFMYAQYGDAATSLWEGGYWRSTSVSFGGLDYRGVFAGTGIRTAPVDASGLGVLYYSADLPQVPGSDISSFVRHRGGATAVTYNSELVAVVDA